MVCGNLRQWARAARPSSGVRFSSEIASGRSGWGSSRKNGLLRAARPWAARARPAFRSTPSGPRASPDSGALRDQFTQAMGLALVGSGRGGVRRLRLRVVEPQEQVLLAVLLAVDDEQLLRLLHEVQQGHQDDAQGQGHERAVEGDAELVG